MKTTLLCLLLCTLAIPSVAQRQLDKSSRDKAQAVVKLLQTATDNQEAEPYAAVMAPDATWNGPAGQDAIGPDSIREAIKLAFENWGRLKTVQTEFRFLAPDLVFAEMYQQITPARGNDVAVAPSSIGPLSGNDLRSTFLLRNLEGQWWVIAVRIADQRAPEARSTRSSATNHSPEHVAEFGERLP